MKHLIIAAAAATLLAGTSSAQTATEEGVTAVDTTTVEMTFVTPTEADFLATRLMGTDIQNVDGETIGEIEDLIVREGTELTGVVVSVGGFLGLGEHHVVVDPSTITISADAGGENWTAMANTTREALEQAPAFEYERGLAQ